MKASSACTSFTALMLLRSFGSTCHKLVTSPAAWKPPCSMLAEVGILVVVTLEPQMCYLTTQPPHCNQLFKGMPPSQTFNLCGGERATRCCSRMPKLMSAVCFHALTAVGWSSKSVRTTYQQMSTSNRAWSCLGCAPYSPALQNWAAEALAWMLRPAFLLRSACCCAVSACEATT